MERHHLEKRQPQLQPSCPRPQARPRQQSGQPQRRRTRGGNVFPDARRRGSPRLRRSSNHLKKRGGGKPRYRIPKIGADAEGPPPTHAGEAQTTDVTDGLLLMELAHDEVSSQQPSDTATPSGYIWGSISHPTSDPSNVHHRETGRPHDSQPSRAQNHAWRPALWSPRSTEALPSRRSLHQIGRSPSPACLHWRPPTCYGHRPRRRAPRHRTQRNILDSRVIEGTRKGSRGYSGEPSTQR
jgi:hypothetical protein